MARRAISSEQIAQAAFVEAAVAAAIVEVGPDMAPAFLEVNHAFCDMVGADDETIRALAVGDVIDQVEEAIASVERGARATPLPTVCVGADGGHVQALVHVTSLGQADGRRLVLLQITDEIRAREVERALRESEKRVQDLVDNVNTLMYIKDISGAYLLVNRHFEEMFGISRFEAPACTNIDFFPPDIAEIYSENDRRVLETGVPMEFEEPQAAGGAWLSLKFPLFDVDGEIYAVGGISTDISERNRAEALIRQAKDDAERANEAMNEFLSRMSHELRTPLNSILGFGQLLQMEAPPGPSRELVTRIVKAGRHLLTLINEVLEISRIEAQGAVHEVEPLDVCGPLTDAVEIVRPLAQQRQIDIVQDLHGGLYRGVLADPQRLTQVLLNVLSNAIKYNRIGGSVRISFRDVENDRLRLSVADTGHGIAPDAIDKVFLPFERAGADRTATEGTGLGLTLSKSLIEEMKGSIGIERSTPGEGTVFFVDLPLADAGSVPPSSHVALRDADSLETVSVDACTVLYVEDNLANLDLVHELFSRVGKVRLIPAVQGHLGVELAERYQPDLILLDLHLPDLDGGEVLRRLRVHPRTSHIPVIVLSADATRDQIERIKLAGAVEYVTKPIDVPAFLRAVSTVLQRGPARPVASSA